MNGRTITAAIAVCACLSFGALTGCSATNSSGTAGSAGSSSQATASASTATPEQALPSFGKATDETVAINCKNGTGLTITQITVETKGAKKQTFLAKTDKIKKNDEFVLNVAPKHAQAKGTSTITLTFKNGESYAISQVPLSKVKDALTFKMKDDLAYCTYTNDSGKTISLYKVEKKQAEKEAAERDAIMAQAQYQDQAGQTTTDTTAAQQGAAATPASTGSASQSVHGCLDDPANLE